MAARRSRPISCLEIAPASPKQRAERQRPALERPEMQKYEPNSSLSSGSHYLVETGAFTGKREADSGSRNTYVLGWRRTSEAGHCSEIGPSKAFLTASAFLASGTLQTQAFARNNPV